jgi:transposase
MSDAISELARRLVVGHKRDGRCVYDAQAKRELILACREPGVSVSKLARDCGVNANQLSAWIRLSERNAAKAVPLIASTPSVAEPAFVAVHVDARPAAQAPSVNLQARLPNGVMVDLRDCDLKQVGGLLEMLGRLRCSASTKG